MSTGDSPPSPLDRSTLQRRAIRGTLWTALHTAVALPMAFGVNVLLARVLGVVDYGRLTFLTTVMNTVAVIVAMGVGTALLQFGAKAYASGDRDEVKKLLSASQGYRLLIAGPVTAIVLILVVRIDPWLMLVAVLFGVLIPSALGGAATCLGIENRSDRGAQVAMIGNFLTQVAVAVTVLTAGTAESVWVARLVVGSLVLGLAMFVITRELRSAVLRPSLPTRLPRAFWAFAVPTGLAAIVSSFVSDRTEVFFLEALGDPRAMGIFALAFGVAAHIYAPAQSFVGPLVPAVSALAQVDGPAVQRAFLRVMRAASTVAALFMTAFLPAFAALLPVIYGVEYEAAKSMLVVLGIVGALSLVGGPFNAFLMARLGGRRLLWIDLFSLVVNVGLALTLIPIWGAWGAVWANAGGMTGRMVLLIAGEARHLRVRRGELLAAGGSLPLGAMLVTLLWLITQHALDLPLMVEVPLLAAAGLCAMVVLSKMLGLGLTGPDAAAIRGALPSFLLRSGGEVSLWVMSRGWAWYGRRG